MGFILKSNYSHVNLRNRRNSFGHVSFLSAKVYTSQVDSSPWRTNPRDETLKLFDRANEYWDFIPWLFFFSPGEGIPETSVLAEVLKHKDIRHQARFSSIIHHRVALIFSSPHVANNVLGFSPTKTNMTLKNHLILNRRYIFIHGFHGCFFQPVVLVFGECLWFCLPLARRFRCCCWGAVWAYHSHHRVQLAQLGNGDVIVEWPPTHPQGHLRKVGKESKQQPFTIWDGRFFVRGKKRVSSQ